MNEIIRAVAWITETANDNSHGYQWGGNGPQDYDCSGLVNAAWIAAGVNVNDRKRNTTQTIRTEYARHGFVNVTGSVNLNTGSGLQPGDVLVNEQNHMAMFIGGGKIVQARSNLDGRAGDSSGQEIRAQSYYNYPWNLVMRFAGGSGGGQTATQSSQPSQSAKPTTKKAAVYLPQPKKGTKGLAVETIQRQLEARGFDVGECGVDGEFGPDTHTAVLEFQKRNSLGVDGVVGPETWAALIGGVS